MMTASLFHGLALLAGCAWNDIGCMIQGSIGGAIQNALGWFMSHLGTLAQTLFLNGWVWLMGGIDPATASSATPTGCTVLTDWAASTVKLVPANCTYPVLTWVDGDITGSSPSSFGQTLAAFYGYTQPAGMMVVAAAAAARIVKVMFEHRAPGHAIILDVLPRAGIGMLAIAGATPVLMFLVLASGAIGHGWWNTISPHLSGSGVAAMAVGQGIFIGIAAFILAFITGGAFLIIFIIPALVVAAMVLYLLVLWIGRMIILLFSFITAPVCIACAVYDPGNRFTKWWLGQFMTALVMPSVIAVGAGTTLVAASTVAQISPYIVGTLLGFIILIGGLWYTGKAVHGLMGDTFSHGGVMKAIEMAGAAIAFAPRTLGSMPGVGKLLGVGNGGSGQSLLARRNANQGGISLIGASQTDGNPVPDFGLGQQGQQYALRSFARNGRSYINSVTGGMNFKNENERVNYAFQHFMQNDPEGYSAFTAEIGPHAGNNTDVNSDKLDELRKILYEAYDNSRAA